jgi:pyruvate,water dikinase
MPDADTKATTEWPPDPIHDVSGPDSRWTSANAGEQMPGLLTPLTARYVIDPAELGVRDAFHDLGVLRGSEVHVAESADTQHVAMFFGRFTTNVDAVRRFFDLTPGASGADYEEQMFGSLKAGVEHKQPKWRYPYIYARMAIALKRVSARSRKLREGFQDWWRSNVAAAETASLDGCREIFADSRAHLRQLLRFHWVATMAAQVGYGKVTALAAEAGRPGLEKTICGGFGTEEVVVAIDLWRVSRGSFSREEFLAEHGHNVPKGAELSALSWREDPTAIDGLLASYGTMPDEDDPALVVRRRREQREEAEAEVLAALPSRRRRKAKKAFEQAQENIQLRTIGKGSMHVSFDVARAAARRAGELLHAAGTIDDPEDVFYLTADEFLGTLPDDVKATVRHRRERRLLYASLELPAIWIGNPQPSEPTVTAEDGPLTGIGTSPGVVEGRVRVVESPTDGDLAPGEILVCETTDPSWISLMVVSAGLVIDIGGPVSHGAIVAREMGVPCVIGVGDGTRRLTTGQWVIVDGDVGTVTVDPAR